MKNIQIVKYTDKYREALLVVWEQSVLATHDFLNPSDFQDIKELVQSIDFNAFEVCCMLENSKVIGFIGVVDRKVEMLFLSPEYLGKGLGKKLLDFAVSKLNADKVDVNEQNTKAVAFYQKYGFKAYERTDKDDQGRDYPLLRMKL
ncbi:GNAT family N-acetyltransferase [Galbibacter sp. EGI 63066]|uniref:GNAT family N-acetyltransferase n=1 Tax=Galbibacter sp. EGI 63066 TaxID=2993559 RepID=UPI0022497429|nr:GNAT family N-acetyltransferase [Galbibacter sp. EGI 63066]MCX2679267.1 GNAT family N-acetyltransferase [Galbibacter sp. EGI 63066]